jgi:hypothetical protein
VKILASASFSPYKNHFSGKTAIARSIQNLSKELRSKRNQRLHLPNHYVCDENYEPSIICSREGKGSMPSYIICAVKSSPISSLTLNHCSHTSAYCQFKESENPGARARETLCTIAADVFCDNSSATWPH